MRGLPLEQILKGGNSEIALLIFLRRLYIVYTHVTSSYARRRKQILTFLGLYIVYYTHVTSKMNPVELRSGAKMENGEITYSRGVFKMRGLPLERILKGRKWKPL